jgi:hypothetical protein
LPLAQHKEVLAGRFFPPGGHFSTPVAHFQMRGIRKKARARRNGVCTAQLGREFASIARVLSLSIE